MGKKIILDHDDLLHEVSQANPSSQHFNKPQVKESVEKAFQYANWVLELELELVVGPLALLVQQLQRVCLHLLLWVYHLWEGVQLGLLVVLHRGEHR